MVVSQSWKYQIKPYTSRKCSRAETRLLFEDSFRSFSQRRLVQHMPDWNFNEKYMQRYTSYIGMCVLREFLVLRNKLSVSIRLSFGGAKRINSSLSRLTDSSITYIFLQSLLTSFAVLYGLLVVHGQCFSAQAPFQSFCNWHTQQFLLRTCI